MTLTSRFLIQRASLVGSTLLTAVTLTLVGTGCGDTSAPVASPPSTATAETSTETTTTVATADADSTTTTSTKVETFDTDDTDTDADTDDDADTDPDTDVGPPPDQTPLGTFKVNGDTLDVSDVSAELAAKANKVWQRYVTLIPAESRPNVVSFELLADTGGGFTNPKNDSPNWEFGIGDEPDPDVLDHIIIHEFGHQLTLAPADQVDLIPIDDSCTNYLVNGGCSLTDSYINRFVEKFWPPSLREENEDIPEFGPPYKKFWEAHKDEFVSEYAATQPAEDIAEVFAFFVTKDRPASTSTIADEKLEFFWGYPEMVALRAAIRTNLT